MAAISIATMNALVLATLVLGASAASIQSSMEYSAINNEIHKIVAMLKAAKEDRPVEGSALIQLEESDLWIDLGEKEDASSMLQWEHVDEDIFEAFDETTEDRIIERTPGLRPNPPKGSALHKNRACKEFESTRFQSQGRQVVVEGKTWKECVESCANNLACSQVVFNKLKQSCEGHGQTNSKTVTMKDGVYKPENFISGQCAITTDELKQESSMLETQTEVQVADEATAEFEQQMKMEEQFAKEASLLQETSEEAWTDTVGSHPNKLQGDLRSKKHPTQLDGTPFVSERQRRHQRKYKEISEKMQKNIISKREIRKELRKMDRQDRRETREGLKEKLGLKVKKPSSGKKCMTFETVALKPVDGTTEKLIELPNKDHVKTTGATDFLQCLHRCIASWKCKQAAYDKSDGHCYLHDQIVLPKAGEKRSRNFLAATCL